MTPEQIISAMQPHLTINLAPKVWQQRAKRLKTVTPGFGCCYPAAEVLYHLWGRENGFKPTFKKTVYGGHWFLKHSDGRILDPTACQFTKPFDYEGSKGCGFLTKELSNRGKILLARIVNFTG